MLKDILETKMLSIGDYHLHLYELVIAFIIITVGYIVDLMIKRGIAHSQNLDSGTK